jgi:hypothetical protein
LIARKAQQFAVDSEREYNLLAALRRDRQRRFDRSGTLAVLACGGPYCKRSKLDG